MKTKQTKKPRFQVTEYTKTAGVRLSKSHSEALNLIAKTGKLNTTDAFKKLIVEKIKELNLEDSENPLKKGEILESINEILRKINTYLNHKISHLPTLQKLNNILEALKVAEQAFDE